MRIHWFQHVPFEDTGSMAQTLIERGHQLSSTHWYRNDAAPNINNFDALIVMGGPMGVYDEAIYPWLSTEKQLIKAAIAEHKIVLGICLGAQLIAEVMGAKVSANDYKEIGWFPLTIPETASTNPVAALLKASPLAFHWHGDTFDLPPHAQLLASSLGCKHQAFCIGDKVWGFQFHLETTRASAEALIHQCASDIDGSRYTQSAAAMLAEEERFAKINQTMSDILRIIFSD